MSWLVEFVAVLVNRYEVGHDGKTPWERLRGKQSRLLGLEFGELLLFRRHRAAGKQAKLDVCWEDGVFLGRDHRRDSEGCDANEDSQKEASRRKMVR